MRINFNEVTFKCAYGTADQLPKSSLPEVSFAGRSNVGKSSLINSLFNRRALAKVSSTPGKTATINFFAAPGVNFVDLPGYGYAKVPESEKRRWSKLIEGYFNQRRRFALVCSLVDIRHDASDLDIDMQRFLRELGLPYAVVFTKADKLSRTRCAEQSDLLRVQLEVADSTPSIITSASEGTGIGDLRTLIDQAVSGASSRRA